MIPGALGSSLCLTSQILLSNMNTLFDCRTIGSWLANWSAIDSKRRCCRFNLPIETRDSL